MRGDFDRASSNPLGEPSAVHRSRFRVGGVSVQLTADHSNDVILVPSLEPFRVEIGVSDINISVEWVPRLFRSPVRKVFDSGSVWRLYEDKAGFQFDFNTPVLGNDPYKRLLVDHEFRRASLLLSEECFPNREFAFPIEYPLDEVLMTHRLTHEKAIELHGCGIVGPDASNLFVGHSCAGKSTTAGLWATHEDVEVLSDDRIIVREHAGGIFMYGTPWHGEAAFASPNRAPLKRILILEHGHGNVLTCLSPSQAVAELFARSFVPFHRHEYLEHALEFLQDVVDAVPVYRFAFEPDQRAVDTILNLHE
jgi:hypothetical protein